MKTVEASEFIGLPIEEVFAFVSKPENEEIWLAGDPQDRIRTDRKVELVSGEPEAPGAVYRLQTRTLRRRDETRFELTEFVRNAKVAYRYLSRGGNGGFAFTLAPEGAGTRLTLTRTWKPRGLLRRVLARGIATQGDLMCMGELQRIRTALEAAGGGVAPPA